MTSSGPSNLASVMGQESVIIYIGSKKKKYMIHKDLLTRKSEYFDRALNGSFKEAEEQSIHLTEESPAAFDLLVNFLYQDRIPAIRSPDGLFATLAARNTPQVVKPPPPPSLFSPPAPPFQSISENTQPSHDTSQPPFWFENKGTAHDSYQPYQEVDHATGFGNQLTSRFDNICAQHQFRRVSPDELRLVDYSEGREANVDSSIGLFGFRHTPTQPQTIGNDPSTSQSESKNTTPVKSSFPQATGHILGIPHCQSLAELAAADEAHQLATLQLCLMAETFCWPDLFNRAMTAYIRGEASFFNRIISNEHIELIYQRSHTESPSRAYAADAFVAQQGMKNVEAAGYARYMDLINDYPAFLEDIFKSMSKNPLIDVRAPKTLEKCEYHDHSDGKHCPKDPSFPGGHLQNSFGVPFGGYQSTTYTGFGRISGQGDPFRADLYREGAMMDWRTAQPVFGEESD